MMSSVKFQMLAAVRLRACWRQLNGANRSRRHLYSLTSSDRPGIVVGVTTTKEENGQQFALTAAGRHLSNIIETIVTKYMTIYILNNDFSFYSL